jgi:hypothetical protein
MTRLLKTLALIAALAVLVTPAYAQSGGIKEPNLSPELDLLVNQGLMVRNATGGTLTAAELVYVCGYLETYSGYVKNQKVCAASNATAGAKAKYILPRAITNNTSGQALKKLRVTAVNTAAASVGDPVYLSTAGGWTLTLPVPPASQQIVGRVAVVHASLGQVEFNLEAESNVQGSVDLTAGSVTPAKMGMQVRAGTALVAGDLVYISSYSSASSMFIVSLADANVSYAKAMYVATGTIGSGSTGTVYRSATISMITTGSVGDPIYLTTTGTTGNTMSQTPPATSNDIIQIVGRVTVVTSTPGTGRALIDLESLSAATPTAEYRGGSFGAATLTAGQDAAVGVLDIYPATTARGKLEVTASNQTGNTTVGLNADAMGQATAVHLADPGVATSYLMQSTAQNTLAENDVLHTNTPGTVAASKAVVVDANKDIGSFNVVQMAGIQGGYAAKTLVSGAAAAAFANVAVPAGSTAGGYIAYCYESTDSTDYQSRCGLIPFAAVAKATAITCTVGTVTSATEVVAVSAGTLTGTISCADATGNVLALKATSTSSLTLGTGYNRIRYRISAFAPAKLVVTPQ